MSRPRNSSLQGPEEEFLGGNTETNSCAGSLRSGLEHLASESSGVCPPALVSVTSRIEGQTRRFPLKTDVQEEFRRERVVLLCVWKS